MELVRNVYERCDISRQAKKLKDCMKVIDAPGNKTTMQIKYFMFSIRKVSEIMYRNAFQSISSLNCGRSTPSACVHTMKTLSMDCVL